MTINVQVVAFIPLPIPPKGRSGHISRYQDAIEDLLEMSHKVYFAVDRADEAISSDKAPISITKEKRLPRKIASRRLTTKKSLLKFEYLHFSTSTQVKLAELFTETELQEMSEEEINFHVRSVCCSELAHTIQDLLLASNIARPGAIQVDTIIAIADTVFVEEYRGATWILQDALEISLALEWPRSGQNDTDATRDQHRRRYGGRRPYEHGWRGVGGRG